MSERTVNQLPSGWARPTLPQIAEINPGFARGSLGDSSPVTFAPMAAVEEQHGGLARPVTRPYGEVKKGYTNFQSGDVLFAKITPCMENGKVCVVPKLPHDVGFGSTEFHVIRPKRDIEAAWISRFLSQESFRRLARSRMTGSAGQMRVPTFFLEELELPVAPHGEQIRILEKMDELFTDLDKGVALLERVRRNLDRYRASVLKAAVEGRLTAAWRKQNKPAESASDLLKRILTERRYRWEESQLAKFKVQRKNPPKNWKDRYEEPEGPNTTDLSELPTGWCWASVDQVAEVQGGLQKSPARTPVLHHFPYLRVANVLRGRLDLTELSQFELSKVELEKLRLKRGDLLIVEGNGSVSEIGRSAIWNGEVEDCVHQNHIIRVRFGNGVLPEYVDALVNSPWGQTNIQRVASSTSGLHTLSVSKVRSIVIPLPPTPEQSQIVEELARRQSVLDAVVESIRNQISRASALRQSILKRAFSGRLVAQNAADAPVCLDGRDAVAVAPPARITSAKATHRPRKSTDEAAQRRKHSKGIYFVRGAIMSYAVDRLHKSKDFGRTQMEKVLHLTQSHVGVDLEFTFKRQAAGPFDEEIYKAESLAKKQRWFVTRDTGMFGVKYQPGTKIADRCKAARTILGQRVNEMDRLLADVAKMDTRQAELLATTYAVWNDLLLDGAEPTKQAIIDGVFAWHPAKQDRFTPEQVEKCVSWMTQNHYVPRGQGQRTVEVAVRA